MNRRDARVMERREQVAKLYLTGHVQSQIARVLKVSQSQVSLDLRVIQRQWQASMVQSLGAIRARELAKCDLLESEAWSAWVASKARQGGCGDPRYLHVVGSCGERRSKLLGLDAPAYVQFDVSALSDAQALRIAHGEAVEVVLAAGGPMAPAPSMAEA